ncbi:MAG: hypothetical protein WD512_12245 [Candidatus Paceibacterota bacterium]
MNILCFFIGAIRNDLLEIKNNITMFKRTLELQRNKNKFNIKYVLITRNPDNVNPYNIDELYKELGNSVEIVIEEPDLEMLNIKCKNNATVIGLTFHTHIKDYINKCKSEFDFIIKCRNDMLIRLNNINKYFNENLVVVPPRYWFNEDKNNLSNDHFYIMHYKHFNELDFTYKNIKILSQISHDCEEVNYNLIKPNKVIDFNDISEYKLNGSLKFHILFGNLKSLNCHQYIRIFQKFINNNK